jgi:hypothetical protein
MLIAEPARVPARGQQVSGKRQLKQKPNAVVPRSLQTVNLQRPDLIGASFNLALGASWQQLV